MALNSAVTDTKWSPNFSAGRPAGDPNVIICHHWGADGQSHQGVVDYLCRADGNSSAHYVASAGRVTQLVHDYDRAWHAGPSGNPRGIGIECRPEMSAGDIATVKALIAAIRAEWGNLPIRGHRDYMSTDCPGRWYAILDQLGDGAAPAPATAPSPAPAPAASLAADGYWGAATTRALQRVLGTPQDGVVSSQDTHWRSQNPGLTSGWEWVSDPVGSQLIQALQRKLGVEADGLIGPGTIRALQQRMGTPVDGCLSDQSQCITVLQQRLQKGTI